MCKKWRAGAPCIRLPCPSNSVVLGGSKYLVSIVELIKSLTERYVKFGPVIKLYAVNAFLASGKKPQVSIA